MAKQIGRGIKNPDRSVKTPSTEPAKKGISGSPRDVLLKRAAPKTEVPSAEEVDYITYRRLAHGKLDTPLTREEFDQLAQSPEVDEFYQRREPLARQRAQEQEGYDRLAAKYEPAKLQASFQRRVTSAQEALQEVGQGNEVTARQYQDIAQVASTLLEVEGDSEEAQDARRYGALVLQEHGSRLAPHLNAALGPDWLAANEQRIDEVIEATNPQGFDKVKDYAGRGLSAVLNFPLVKIPLDTLNNVEQAWFHTLYGLGTAIDPSTEDRGAYLRHAASSAGRGVTSLVPGVEGIKPSRAVTIGDSTYEIDSDASGDSNLREFMHIDPEVGGFWGDVGDLIGTILLDPTSYLSVGTKPAAKLVVGALSESSEHLARKAGTQLASGAKLSQLDDVTQLAVKSELLNYQIKAVGHPRNRQVVTQALRRNPSELMGVLRKEQASVDRVVDGIIRTRTDKLTRAAERGVVPAVRIGGRTVIPMRRFYDALGLIDTHLASEEAWALRALQLSDIEGTDDLLSFINRYDGGEIPEELREQIYDWSALSTRMADDPESWLDDLLQRSPGDVELERAGMDVGPINRAFDQIEAFGRALYGDEAVAGWRPYFETQWARTVKTGTRKVDDLPTEKFWAKVTDEGIPLKRAVKALEAEDLPILARERISRNLDVFEEPVQWMARDGILPRGLRALATRDTILGNLTRRFADALSPRAGIRRTGDLGPRVASSVDDLSAQAAAQSRDLVTDHVRRLDVDGAGRSRLAARAADEMGGEDELRSTLNRVLALGTDDIADEVAQLVENGSVATAQLLQVSNDIREDIFRLSVGAGFDEEILAGIQGYLPRTFSEEAVTRATRAAVPGSKTASEVDAFRSVGLIDDSGRVSHTPNPLTQEGHALGRTLNPEIQDLFEANEAALADLRRAGLIDEAGTFKLYEGDPIRAILLRSREAHEAHAWMQLVDGMTDLTDLDGRSLAYLARSKDDIASVAVRMAGDDASYTGATGAKNFISRDLPNGGKYWMRREILTELEKTRRILEKPGTFNTLQRFFTRWNDIWGAYATVPLVGTSFHLRNATGNMFNMVLAGVKNPGVLADAFHLQRVNREAVKAMRAEGLDFPTALRATGVDEGTVELLVDARKFGVIGTGQTSDIFSAADNLTGTGGRQRFSPLDQRNVVLRTGRATGEAIEGNARLGLFIDGKVHKGMNSADAAQRVRQYLFDYNDLTAFESGTMRMLSRFWTFTRKNTALQFRTMMNQPGSVHNAQRISEAFTDQLMGAAGFDSEGNVRDAGVTRESGEKIPSWVPPTMRMFRDSEGNLAVAGVDSPFGAAAETVDSLAAAIKMPAAFLHMMAADTEFEQEERGEAFRDQMGSGLSLLSGGPVEGVKTIMEFSTGKDLFTGGDLSDVDRNYLDTLFRISDVLVPALSKVDREAEKLGVYRSLGVLQDEDQGGDRAEGPIRLMNTLLGLSLQTGLSDPGQIDRNMRSLSWELDKSLEEVRFELEDAGIEVPDFRELQESGDVFYRNRAFEFLLYRTLDGEPLTDEERVELNRIAPAEVLEAAGINVPEKERSEWDVRERARRVREIVSVLESNGVQVTDEMVDALILRESGARISDVKDLGIEPSFLDNPYLDPSGDPEEAARKRQEQSVTRLTALADTFGVTIKELQGRYPLMQDAERIASQMAEAGATDHEIVAELTEKLSRQERALIFGEGTLETEYSYEALTPEEVIEFQQKAAKADAELRVIMNLVVGRQPTQYELDEWLSEVLFLAPEQTKLGFDNYKPPSRENVTPDAVYDERLRQKLEATTNVTDFLATVGEG